MQTLSFSFVYRYYWLNACPKLDLSNLHRRSVDLTQHPLSFRNTAEQSAHRQSIKTCWMRFFNWPVDWFHIRFPYSFQLNNLCLWSGSRDAQAGEIQKGWEPTLKLGSLRFFTGGFNFGKHVTFTQIPEIAIIRLIGIWTFFLLVNHQLSDPIGVEEFYPTIKQAETLRVPAGESRRNLYVLQMWPSWIIHDFGETTMRHIMPWWYDFW